MSFHFRNFTIESVSFKKVESWTITFLRSDGGATITMQIPKSGIFEDPKSDKMLSYDECEKLAQKVGHILCSELK